MKANDLDNLLAEVDRLSQAEPDDDVRTELVAIRERIIALRSSPLVSPEARGVLTDEARKALGLDASGEVHTPQTLQEAIKRLAASFETAREDHDKKKEEVASFLKLLWPQTKATRKTDASALLQELEATRRFLIVIKKYLAELNEDKIDGERVFALEDEHRFKDVYYGLIAKARIYEQTIARSGLHRNIKTRRFFYDTSARPLIPDLDQRWAGLWEGHSAELQRLHQHNEYSGDTIDYLQREDRVVLLFYPGDVRERWAFSHRRDKPTSQEVAELLQRSGVVLANHHVPDRKKEFKEKHKKQRCDALLDEVLKIAGPDGALAARKQTRHHHQLLNRHLSRLIREARMHSTELLATYTRKYTAPEYVGKVKSLDKPIPDVTRRLGEWESNYEGLLAEINPLWQLADDRGGMSDADYKAALFPAVRVLIGNFPGGRVWDFAYSKLSGHKSDGSDYKHELGDWEELYEQGLIETFGEDEAVQMPRDLPIMDLLCMWLFAPAIPPPPPDSDATEPLHVSTLFWLWKEGHFDDPEAADEWLLPYEIDWTAFLARLPREDCELLHDVVIRSWEAEMFQLHELMDWAKGNIAERRAAKWIEHGTELANKIAEANGIIAFVDTYEACYDKMVDFIGWVLFPRHEQGRSRDYEQLAVGAGLVNFSVSISIEASLFSRINASATLSYQYTGKIAQEDDRRVRWSGTHSFNLSIAADAKLTLADIVDTQTALDVLKASVAADKELYSAVTVSVHESPRHLAAVWAQDLARARYWLTTPVNGINTPGGFKRFRGVPETETQQQILERIAGGKQAEILELLKRPRVEAKRRGLSDYESDWKLSAELAVPLLRGKIERLAEAKTVMHFGRRKMDPREQPEERYSPDPVTYTWSKGMYAYPFEPAKLDTSDLGLSLTKVVDPTENPLDLFPEESSDPPTTELLGGFLEADNGEFAIGFTNITNHPNPDNDGMYLNINSSRNWGVGIRTGDVTFSFQRTQKWLKVDPVKLRFHFNYMVEACRRFFRDWVGNRHALPDLERSPPSAEVKDALYGLILGIDDEEDPYAPPRTDLPLFDTKPGSSMLWRMRALSLFGAFELNFVYNGQSGFEVQYGRIWITSKIIFGYKASLPPFPFVKVGVEISGEMSHCQFELLGLYTLTYIITVYNGCRKRYDPRGQQNEWKAWCEAHREELLALFNKLADPGANTHAELRKVAKGGDCAAKAPAQALLDIVEVEVDDHNPGVWPPKAPAKRGGKIPVGSTKGSPTVLGGGDFGVTSLSLYCHVGGHRSSTRFYRRGTTIYRRGGTVRGKVVSPTSNPIFIVAPGNTYDIEFRLEHPKRIRELELDIFDASGASVLAKPWVIDARELSVLFDPDKPTAREREATYEGDIVWYGSKDGKLSKGAIARIEARALQDAAPLPSTLGHYCMVLSVKQATTGPAEAALAWTYFTVLDEPLAKLDEFLAGQGKDQDDTVAPRWTKPEDESGSASKSKPKEKEPDKGALALPERREDPAKAPKESPAPKPKPAVLRPIEDQPSGPRQVIGIENLGPGEGYTCYINASLQLLIHGGLLPKRSQAKRAEQPAIAQQVVGFAEIYETQRKREVDYIKKSSLNGLRELRTLLHRKQIVTQLQREDDAAAVLFGLLDACAEVDGRRRRSKAHFGLRVTKTFAPGVGRAILPEEAAKIARDYVELGPDDTTVAVEAHSHVLIDGVPSRGKPTLTGLWDAMWDFDASRDNPSTKYRDGMLYVAAQPLHQTIAFEGAPPTNLLVTLKRFAYGDGGAAKISTPVSADFELTRSGQDYALRGFIVHIGERLDNGHYVTYLLCDAQWYWCSDSSVRAVDEETVRDELENGYIYLYQAVGVDP